MAHTPGPWHFNGWQRVTPVEGEQNGTNDICHVYSNKHDERANARLIAAAPELLLVLQEFVATNRSGEYEFDTNEPRLFKAIVEAIAKATT